MPSPHPSWEVEQLIRTRILQFHTWLTEGLAMEPGQGKPTCAVEAVAKMETFYNIIQNGEQFHVDDGNGGTDVHNIFPDVSVCDCDCPEPEREPEK